MYYVPKGTPNMKALFKDKSKQILSKDEVERLVIETLGKDGKGELAKKYLWMIGKIVDEIQENEKTDVIELKGSGRFSFVLRIGNKILKIGYPRHNFQIPYAKEILQPIARKEFESFITIEVSENVDTDWYQNLTHDEIENEIYQVWKSMREQGAIWLDANAENIGVLKKDNVVHWKPYYCKSDKKNHLLEVPDASIGVIPSNVQKTILPAGSKIVLDTDLIYTQDKIAELNALYKKNPNATIFQTKQYRRYKMFEDRYQNQLNAGEPDR